MRQEARKKKLKADREELQSFRKGSKGGGAKGSQDPKVVPPARRATPGTMGMAYGSHLENPAKQK